VPPPPRTILALGLDHGESTAAVSMSFHDDL
jgi:hypothetical protein